MSNRPFRVYLERHCEAGKPWAVRLCGVSRYPTLSIEFFGAVGGIFRYFPRGRDEMVVHFQHPNAGTAHVFVTARDERCLGVRSCKGEFAISPAGAQSLMRTPLRDDEDGDDWQSKMDEIDTRFSWKSVNLAARTAGPSYRGDDVDGYDRPGPNRGDDVDGYNRPHPDRGDDVDGYDSRRRARGDDVDGYDQPDAYRGDDVDGYYLRNLVSLPATGKPPVSSTWPAEAAAPQGAQAATSAAAGDHLSDLINAKTQDLLNRLGKR